MSHSTRALGWEQYRNQASNTNAAAPKRKKARRNGSKRARVSSGESEERDAHRHARRARETQAPTHTHTGAGALTRSREVRTHDGEQAKETAASVLELVVPLRKAPAPTALRTPSPSLLLPAPRRGFGVWLSLYLSLLSRGHINSAPTKAHGLFRGSRRVAAACGSSGRELLALGNLYR